MYTACHSTIFLQSKNSADLMLMLMADLDDRIM